MLKISFFVTCVFSLLAGDVIGYRILVVFPIPARSHMILGNGYVKHLLSAGHEVTYITPETYKEVHPNLTIVSVSDNLNFFPENLLNLKSLMKPQDVKLMDTMVLVTLMYELCKNTLTNPNVEALLKDDGQKFDLVIAEWTYNELYSGFSAVYDCPYIWANPVIPNWAAIRLVDEATNPAYTADGSSGNIPPFNFKQRLQELGTQIGMSVVKWALTLKDKALYSEIFGPVLTRQGRILPSYNELQYNASLIFGNSNQPLSPAIRLPANYKEIGGYHIETHVTPLLEELKNIMDNAKDGVIYFSMGSNAKSKDMPDDTKRELLEAFGKLKQIVLWKFEEDLPNVPKNVYLLKWAPQPSILKHPNCVIFISHGGLLSITETIHYGVPVIGVPAFGDQFLNVQRAVHKGFAIKVALSENMAIPLKEAILEMISNRSYSNRAKELSSIFHDRLVTPRQELVHWVEHVVRTGGAPHLRSPALLVPLYQKLYLDLIFIIISVTCCILYCVRFVRNLLLSAKCKKDLNEHKKRV